MESLDRLNDAAVRHQSINWHAPRLCIERCLTGVAITGLLGLASVAHGQDLLERPVSIHIGVGAGYTAAPGFAGESSGGGWNGEAFALLAFRGVPVELRSTMFSYGRGATERTQVFADCRAPGCLQGGTIFSGSERASGGSLDALVRLAHGPLVPYVVGGLGAAYVSRQDSEAATLHGTGFAYEYGAGLRATVGRAALFAEAKFFGTKASAEQFDGHSVHMVPVTLGFMF